MSYEFRDLAGGYQYEFGSGGRLQLRAGAVSVWRPKKGYYSEQAFEPELRPLAGSHRNTEWYAQFDYQHPHLVSPDARLGPKILQFERWAFFASADLRDKTVLNYHKARQADPEDHQLSPNVRVGYRTLLGHAPLALRAVYFRWYRGVNPHGQLRNQKDYTVYGLGLIGIWTLYGLLYAHALRLRHVLNLTPAEVVQTREPLVNFALNIAVCTLSIVLAHATSSSSLPGFVYMALGPVLTLNGMWHGRQVKRMLAASPPAAG